MENMLNITKPAVERYQKMMLDKGEAGRALRIRVVGGGCSGMTYEMGFESEAKSDDQVLEFHGMRVFVDPKSVPHLKGVQIDYKTGLTHAGFKIVNPNAKSTCGCGESFS